MSEKIDYDLIFATTSNRSKDAEDVTRDLKLPDLKGWGSKKLAPPPRAGNDGKGPMPRNPTYPQTMVFQLAQTANLLRVELRIHDRFVRLAFCT